MPKKSYAGSPVDPRRAVDTLLSPSCSQPTDPSTPLLSAPPASVRCTPGFLTSCVSLSRPSPTGAPLLSPSALQSALHLHPHAVGSEGEALCGHTGAALSSLDCGYDVLSALLIITRHALRSTTEGGADVLQGSNAEGTHILAASPHDPSTRGHPT
jgi:hypothetical protein